MPMVYHSKAMVMKLKTAASMKRSKQKGFTLIEVLIAILVLAIGMLGMAGLQSYSVSSSYNAHLRTQATLLAQSIVDRMRANPQAAADNNYLILFSNEPGSVNCNAIGSNCSHEQLADYDLREWKCLLGNFVDSGDCEPFATQSTLPAGNGEIIREPTDQSQTRVTVQWTDAEGQDREVVLRARI